MEQSSHGIPDIESDDSDEDPDYGQGDVSDESIDESDDDYCSLSVKSGI